MKKSILLLLLVSLTSLSLSVSAERPSQGITISGENVSLQKVFKKITKVTGYAIFCDYNLIQEAGLVTLNVKNASLEAVLDSCLKDKPLSFEIIGKTIVITKKEVAPVAVAPVADIPPGPPPIDVHGRVIDEKGSPVVAATVEVRGTRKVTTTNDNGEFTLTGISDNAVLIISSVGFDKAEVKVAGQTQVAVTLKINGTLNETVVTALGLVKEARKVGYSVGVVNGDQLTKARETNVALSLEGQVSGLDVHGTNGGPGGTARILLRGVASINAGGPPLFVINGVPMDNSQRGAAGEWGGSDNGDGIGNINPDDIETMTVLKGQAASALYGTRASNGVIMITTKSGKRGQTDITYNLNALWDKPIDNTDFQYQYGQGLEGAKPVTAIGAENTNRFSWGSKLDGSQTIQYNGNMYPYSAYTYKQNMNQFYRTGPSLTNTVSASGGTDRTTFRLSLSDLDNSSIVRNSGIDRKTINLNVTEKFTDKLSATVIANYIDQQNRNQPSLSDGPGNPNNFLELAANVNDNIFKPGYNAATGMETQFSDDNYATNPWFVVNKWINNLGRNRLITNLSAKYQFTPWLYAMVRMGYDLENDRQFNVTPTGTLYSYNSAGQSGQFNGLTTQQHYELNVDELIGVSHKLYKELSLDATLGATERKDRWEEEQLNGGQFVIPYLYTPSNVVTFNRYYAYALTKVNSGFYSLDFDWDNWLIINTTGRTDAYSTLPSNNNTIFTPSVSGSFIFSQFVTSNVLSYGKLRAAYAQTSGEPNTGNFGSGAYQDAIYYGVGNPINGTPTGNYSSALPNLFLKPFTKSEEEFGFEMKFWQNRLGIDADYFTSVTHHEITSAALSTATGYSSDIVGTGSIQNRGIEVKLTGTPIKTHNFEWDLTVNYTHVNNKVLETDEAGNDIGLGGYRPLNASTALVKGMSGPQILAHDYVRDAKGNIEVNGNGAPLATPGYTPFGSVIPTDYGGVKTDFILGNWNLSALFTYNYGSKILSATNYWSLYRGLNKETLVGREGGITTGVNSVTDAPNTVAATAQDYYQALGAVSRVNVLNGDYIKLKQLTLGYTLGRKILGDNPVFNSITISAVARNLWTVMKKSPNIDPESEFQASVYSAGIEGTSLPSTTTFGFNATFKFKN
ncbi:MAG TPA: SusC/RagA family TonB-linked outer membrane protein [Puia sp.]|nr:SusC/RagA family TonB-linked outer membrane protein [Puia sp.]